MTGLDVVGIILYAVLALAAIALVGGFSRGDK